MTTPGSKFIRAKGRNLGLLPLVVLVAAAFCMNAQSFDCSKAAMPYEKFICAHKELSAMDSNMAAAYKAALSHLSEEGKRRLVESQRSWLKYGRTHPNATAFTLF